jgi:hypothetical protein
MTYKDVDSAFWIHDRVHNKKPVLFMYHSSHVWWSHWCEAWTRWTWYRNIFKYDQTVCWHDVCGTLTSSLRLSLGSSCNVNSSFCLWTVHSSISVRFSYVFFLFKRDSASLRNHTWELSTHRQSKTHGALLWHSRIMSITEHTLVTAEHLPASINFPWIASCACVVSIA